MASCDLCPGANDNASGVAATLEAARALAATPISRTVQFVLFGAEEFGAHGSFAFVSERRRGVVAMVNLDMVGWGERLMVGSSPGYDPALVTSAERVAQRLGIPVSRFRSGASDHLPFEPQSSDFRSQSYDCSNTSACESRLDSPSCTASLEARLA